MNHNELAMRCSRGEFAAARELIALQREGRALRLYPFGRNGALDEGYQPVVLYQNEECLLTLEVGRTHQFAVKREDLGAWACSIMKGVAACMLEFDDDDQPFAAMRQFVTDDFEFESRAVVVDREVLGMEFRFHPGYLLKWDFGAYQGCQMLAAITCMVEQAELEPEDCGFNWNDYEDASLFADWAVRTAI